MRRKIVFLIRSLDVGGAQRQLIELAKGLRAAAWDVAVVTYYGGGALEAELRDAGVRHVAVGKSRRWDVAGFGARLVRVLRREAPSVVHGYLPDANLLVAALRPLLRGARVVWGVRASNMDLAQYDWLARRVFAATRRLSRAADLIICNSHDGAKYHVAQGYPAARVVVVPNGFDIRRFRPDAEAGARVRQGWGVGASERLVGVVGRLDPVKDHETFLKAAARVAAEAPDVRFVCVGDGERAYAERLQALAASLGVADRLLWVPPQPDAHAVYNALDVLTMCSRSEGLPNVVGEAMACGVPCVVTDVGDAAWLVGDTGRVVPVGDPAALASGLLETLAERAAARAPGLPACAPCRCRVERELSLDALVRNTERALATLSEAA